MPSVELSKLQGIAAPRAVSTGERAQILGRAHAVPSPGTPASGVHIEIGGGVEAASAPVDAERVAQIRAALRDGTYPLVPTRIADAIIAAQISFTLPDKD
jgi:negative regulator of flagellin synthesis FlgM